MVHRNKSGSGKGFITLRFITLHLECVISCLFSALCAYLFLYLFLFFFDGAFNDFSIRGDVDVHGLKKYVLYNEEYMLYKK